MYLKRIWIAELASDCWPPASYYSWHSSHPSLSFHLSLCSSIHHHRLGSNGWEVPTGENTIKRRQRRELQRL